jgi:hypothetical protein
MIDFILGTFLILFGISIIISAMLGYLLFKAIKGE